MACLNVEKVSITLDHGADEPTVRQVGSPDLCTGQVFVVLEVQLVSAIVEHVNHLMCQHRLHHLLIGGAVLANNDLSDIKKCI